MSFLEIDSQVSTSMFFGICGNMLGLTLRVELPKSEYQKYNSFLVKQHIH